MTSLKLPSLLSAPLLLALGAGCSTTGGQTGEETQDPCVESKLELQPDQVSALGFSGRQVLTGLGETSSAALTWLPASELSYGPETGMSTLTFVVRSFDTMYYVESEARSTESLELMPVCQDRVEIELVASAATAGGAVAEEFETTLRAASTDAIWLTQIFEPATLSGAFSVDPQSLGTSRFTRFTLEAHWSAGTFGGLLTVGLEQVSGKGSDANASFRMVPVGCFSNSGTFDPTTHCGPLP